MGACRDAAPASVTAMGHQGPRERRAGLKPFA